MFFQLQCLWKLMVEHQTPTIRYPLEPLEGWSRVIQIWQKWQTLYFSTFLARFRIFWKMMFGKMQKFFWYDHSKGCLERPKVLLHNAPMWNGAKRKIQFFSVFSKTKKSFAVWILYLHKKCDLLRYIMLM